MTQPKEYSSLPLVMAITGVILLTATIGWFLARQEAAADTDDVSDSARSQSVVSTDGSMPIAAPMDIDAELRKARLAASADFIAAPSEQNALYYYSRVLTADPRNDLAIAELGVVLARVAMIVGDFLAAGEYNSAYNLAARAAELQPEHPIVNSIRSALNDYLSNLVAQAVKHAEDGNDNDATAILASLQQLPGLSTGFLTASRSSVDAIQQARTDAERIKLEEIRVAEERAVSEWTQQVREAIDLGQLIAPEGDNAREYLTSRDTPAEVKDQLTKELLAALMAASEQSLGNGELTNVELYLGAANDLSVRTVDTDSIAEVVASAETNPLDSEDGGVANEAATLEDGTGNAASEGDDPEDDTDGVEKETVVATNEAEVSDDDTLAELRDTVERKLVLAQGSKIMALADFVRVSTPPAEYPFIASKRNITGWVDVEFTVTASGGTANIDVVRSQPEDVFEVSAVEAVRQWTFQPREYRGQSIDQRAGARLVFDIE